ncbi:Ppx/GppA family phosphatase [Sphingomonas sp. LaA6.9]|uniref:Ppx/GppA family phosphatase n=1 Tax=Sphingomonas sp. LaA6.9 TaxID=2919914 RepID=UPI001F502F82|nr:Ppx/GppA family phosphatase [Sphingomonas sp. LaA6.9]MCJ8159328.1 Ppx/GppA family phosphatase [Sphingomonas sp. LaA6.9]
MASVSPVARTRALSRADQSGRRAIIDIGSNSIRLVVFDGPERLPAILFNEKVMAGLGRNLSRDGLIDAAAVEVSVRALRRFRQLSLEMGVSSIRTVATAAVREARNASELLARIRDIGIDTELLSGQQEAEAAGLGVISAIPEADGIVGDLGGGSLELIRVRDGQTLGSVSLPLGVLRLAAIRQQGKTALKTTLAKMLKKQAWLREAKGLPFYMVGGSWRALARLDMHLSDYPLPIIHQYRMESDRAQHLVRSLAKVDRKKLQALPTLSDARIPTLGNAGLLLSALVRELDSSELIVSASGLREGLLFQMLDAEQRRADPLIVAARAEGVREGRFPEHGDLLEEWIAPLFADETAEGARLRHAACLLADVAWRANPEFRAERGLETALHGNWVGIDATGRAMIGQALATSFGAGATPLAQLEPLASPRALRDAVNWGLAMRLGQRFSGGVATPLLASAVSVQNGVLVLAIDRSETSLYGEAVERRHRQLANAMGLSYRMVEKD